ALREAMHRSRTPTICSQSLFIRSRKRDMKVEYYLRSAFIVLWVLLCVLPLFAQQAPGALHGQVTDPSGAAISGASVIMTPAAGSPIVVQSNGQGMYEFKSLPAGTYTLTVAATGFTL